MSTKVIIIRSEAHVANILLEHDRHLAILSGKRLAEKGLIADVAVSSPDMHALETLICNLTGMGSILPIHTDDHFGDTPLVKPTCHESVLEEMKDKANAAGMTLEQYLLSKEQGYAIHCEVLKHTGKTIVVCSSNEGTAILSMIRSLDLNLTDKIFQEGASALLTFDDDPSRTLVRIEYFGNLGIPEITSKNSFARGMT